MSILINFRCDNPTCRECQPVQMTPNQTWQQILDRLDSEGWLLKVNQGKVEQAICPFCDDPPSTN